jgi:endoglucanase
VSLRFPCLPFPAQRINLVRPTICLMFLAAVTTQVVAATAYIRVNQLGYELGSPARAYLMSTRPVSGMTYLVIDSGGATVLCGPVGTTVGTFGSFTIYPIDFTLEKQGNFTVKVSGPVSATSLAFRVDRPADLYTSPLAHSLSFYQNERDGADFIPSPLRTAAGHLNDRHADVYSSPRFNNNDLILGSLTPTGQTINAEGGWWDAGDYLKFVQTHSYTVALMLIGVRDFPEQMGSRSTTSNFTDEAMFGLRWLQRMWDDQTKTLYYQVGIGTDFKSYNFLSDHDIWRLPQVDDKYAGADPQFQYIRDRPVFVAGYAGSKISPNLAGRLAADFAECFQVYGETHRTLAEECLRSAEHIFDLADTAPTGNLLTVAPFDFYPENEWRDDLELGATELYFALRQGNLPPGLPHTNPAFYLRAAAQWAHAYIQGPNDQTDTLNLYDVSGLAHFELHRAIELAGRPDGLAVKQSELVADIKNQMTSAIASASNDPFGFGWPWASYDTVSHGAGLSVMANEYFHLTGDRTFAAYSRRWMANISGANAWGVTFTIGDGSVFPNCPQHQVANLVGSLNGGSPVLDGGVVEGPNSAATAGLLDNMLACPTGGGNSYKKFNGNGTVYKDNVQSYSTDEPAIDLSSTSFLMYSWASAGAPHQKQ